MIEDELRRTFERLEELVPDGAHLRTAIDSKARGRRTRRRWVGSAAAAFAVVLAVGVPTLGRAYLPAPGDTNLPFTALSDPSGNTLAGRPLTFLLAGLDHQPGSTDPVRADTIIIARLPADRSRLYLVTLPRDLFVTVSGHGRMKINESYAIGGMPLLAGTVSALSGLTFDGAATMEYQGLTRVVNAVGGVDLCIDQKTTSIHTGRSFLRGCQHFTGAQAMDYLRQRMDLTHGALDRDRHQVQLLATLLGKLNSAGALPDIGQLSALLRAAGPSLVVDLAGNDLADLVRQALPALGSVVGVACPVTDGVEVLDGRSGLLVNADTEAFFQAVRGDDLASWLRSHPTAVISQRRAGSG